MNKFIFNRTISRNFLSDLIISIRDWFIMISFIRKLIKKIDNFIENNIELFISNKKNKRNMIRIFRRFKNFYLGKLYGDKIIGCNGLLADGQWYSRCGESDMGQIYGLCEECINKGLKLHKNET